MKEFEATARAARPAAPPDPCYDNADCLMWRAEVTAQAAVHDSPDTNLPDEEEWPYVI